MKMRDECIALEAVRITIAQSRRDAESKTIGELALEAIAKVDAACQAGELGLLHRSWTRDPDDR